MNIKILEEFYSKNDLSGYNSAKVSVLNFLDYLLKNDLTLDKCTVESLEWYMTLMVAKKENDLDSLLGLLRYFSVTGTETLYLYFLTLLGGYGVMESIKTSISEYENVECAEEVFEMGMPELGESLGNLSKYTCNMMVNLKEKSPDQYFKILAGNHHNLPVETQDVEKAYYTQSSSFETYLNERHKRKVKELEDHLSENKVWFEQKVTTEMVNFVKEHAEVLSGVVHDGKLFVTKIPYNTDAYLNAETDVLKRYHYCHCSYAKAAIINEEINLDPDWCYCSAGFAKYPFEVILEKKLTVKVLASVLKGDQTCRFEIDLGDTWEK